MIRYCFVSDGFCDEKPSFGRTPRGRNGHGVFFVLVVALFPPPAWGASFLLINGFGSETVLLCLVPPSRVAFHFIERIIIMIETIATFFETIVGVFSAGITAFVDAVAGVFTGGETAGEQ